MCSPQVLRNDDEIAAMRELLRLEGISKIYPSVIANDSINLSITEGEIHAVLGENGAGKSTLMKLIYGVSQPDRGTLYWQGKAVQVRNPAHARALGIGMVFQHFSLFETMTVAENISLAVPGTLKDLSTAIIKVATGFGLPVSPDTLVYSLSVGERQRVEIIRCILQQPKLLIMDEPTSVLPPQGVEMLFETLRKLAADGCSILYISHKMDEIRSLCDRATVLRDGKLVDTVVPSEQTSHSLAKLMIGHDIPQATHKEAAENGAIRLNVKQLNHVPDDPFGTTLNSLSLKVRAGEIVGIAGVSGNGQNELMRMISGETRLKPPSKGQVALCGKNAGHLAPMQRRRLGFAFVPEERLGRGAVPDLNLAYNSLLTGLEKGLTKLGFIRFGKMKTMADECISNNDVRCGGSAARASSLSGGNLQKFIVGREMALAPELLVLSQPTWGVDVGAAAAIRQALITLRDSGTAILLVSEELEELFEITDRMYVMFNGHLSESLPTRSTDAEQIGEWMTGAFLSSTSATTLAEL
ncbi:MAG: ABC-type uncharacterized transport system ATPase subunit [Granulosicoccus sp.]